MGRGSRAEVQCLNCVHTATSATAPLPPCSCPLGCALCRRPGQTSSRRRLRAQRHALTHARQSAQPRQQSCATALLSPLPQPAPLFASLQSSGQRQWPQPQNGIAAAISRRLLTTLHRRTTPTTKEQPSPVPAAQSASRGGRKAIGHIDVQRTADCANPWLCGMCVRSVR